MSTLYVVATPIGNLEDITQRALRVLKECSVILAEDTRVTKKLLSHYGISTPTMSYHANSKLAKLDRILSFLEEGNDVALVSDAGTPAISDPGVELVAAIRKQLPDVRVVTVPGASALTAAVSIAGLPAAQFTFLGFLPHKKGRETLFAEIAANERATIFYESPHRIIKTLQSLSVHAPDRTVMIARELTKLFEETLYGTPAELLAHFDEHPDTVRGEFVVLVAGE
ncbi:MAG: uroporphyrin-III C/tetrapyrrole (Corrin/Porphyrin) methyltransferase, rRNA [Candidatus Parcubacteria bacterium]|jgi:16S rRNA (cytidine1402-2'-O)-methyltransferase